MGHGDQGETAATIGEERTRPQPLQGRTRPTAAPGILAVEAQAADHAGAGGYAIENMVRKPSPHGPWPMVPGNLDCGLIHMFLRGQSAKVSRRNIYTSCIAGYCRDRDMKAYFGGLKMYLQATDHTSSNIISRDGPSLYKPIKANIF
jgi:hypothetical protein